MALLTTAIKEQDGVVWFIFQPFTLLWMLQGMSNSTSNQPSEMSQVRLILTTCSSPQEAELLAKGLLSQKLAACVNLLPQLTSWYVWQEKLQHESECQLIIKTAESKVASALHWLRQHHPYDTPELLVVPVETGSLDYLTWIQNSCN